MTTDSVILPRYIPDFKDRLITSTSGPHIPSLLVFTYPEGQGSKYVVSQKAPRILSISALESQLKLSNTDFKDGREASNSFTVSILAGRLWWSDKPFSTKTFIVKAKFLIFWVFLTEVKDLITINNCAGQKLVDAMEAIQFFKTTFITIS